MRRGQLVALLSASTLALSACVQTRQIADVEFQPPQGDYDLVVMRPSVQVGSSPPAASSNRAPTGPKGPAPIS